MTCHLEVLLDNFSEVCYAGQRLSGKVQCHFDREETLRAVRIRFKGRAEVKLDRLYDDPDIVYTNEEVFFHNEYDLVPRSTGESCIVIPAGLHIYPISFTLPLNLPSSYEGLWGNVRYYIRATATSLQNNIYTGTLNLNITPPIDLNYFPECKNSVALSNDQIISSCCWELGPITFNVSLPHTGYTPGQEVLIAVYVKNMSNVSAHSVRFKLSKFTEYVACNPSPKNRWTKEDIVSIIDNRIEAYTDRSWTAKLVVPTDKIYPNLLWCNIIKVSYYLKASVVLLCPYNNLEIKIPIQIGNIPISDVFEVNGPLSTLPHQIPFLPDPHGYPPTAPNDLPSVGGALGVVSPGESGSGHSKAGIDPPSYEEAERLLNEGKVNTSLEHPKHT